MANTATLTLKTGPNVTNTAVVIPNVSEFTVQTVGEVLLVTSGSVVKQFALSGGNTWTLTSSGGNYSLTVT